MVVKGKKGKPAANKDETASTENEPEEANAAVEETAEKDATKPEAENKEESDKAVETAEITNSESKEDEANGENEENEENKQNSDEANNDANTADDPDEDVPTNDRFCKSSIFIGNAPLDAKEENIREHFKKYGTIKKVSIIQENNEQRRFRSKKPAPKNISSIIYVDFETEEEAKNACEENQKLFEDKRLRVNMARERPKTEQKLTLFVGNLSFSTLEEELYDTFAIYGEIDFVRIVAGKGYGFVHFKDEESIIKSVEKNKTEFCGRTLLVERSRSVTDNEAGNKRKRNDSTGSRNKGGKTATFNFQRQFNKQGRGASRGRRGGRGSVGGNSGGNGGDVSRWINNVGKKLKIKF